MIKNNKIITIITAATVAISIASTAVISTTKVDAASRDVKITIIDPKTNQKSNQDVKRSYNNLPARLNSLQNIKVYIDPKLPFSQVTAIKYALGAWETSGFLNFVTTSDPDSAQIVYTSSTAEIADDLAGETMLSYYPSGNAYQIISSEISLSYNGETQTTEDMVHTATHETGHALGLDDETDPSLETTSVMYYQLTDHSSDLGYFLHDYDLQKLYSLYFPGAKYNDSISNNTFVRTTKWDSAIVNKDGQKVGVVPAYSSWAVKTGYLNIETNTSYYQVGNNQYISENDLY